MSRPIQGRVTGLKVTPGQQYIIVYVEVEKDREPQPHILQPSSYLKWGGNSVLLTTVLHQAMILKEGKELHVTLHPVQEHGDASTNADFVIKNVETITEAEVGELPEGIV